MEPSVMPLPIPPMMLLRRIAGLIYVPDRERGIARQRALKHIADVKAAAHGAH